MQEYEVEPEDEEEEPIEKTIWRAEFDGAYDVITDIEFSATGCPWGARKLNGETVNQTLQAAELTLSGFELWGSNITAASDESGIDQQGNYINGWVSLHPNNTGISLMTEESLQNVDVAIYDAATGGNDITQSVKGVGLDWNNTVVMGMPLKHLWAPVGAQTATYYVAVKVYDDQHVLLTDVGNRLQINVTAASTSTGTDPAAAPTVDPGAGTDPGTASPDPGTASPDPGAGTDPATSPDDPSMTP